MESKDKKVELLQIAIKQLIEEEKSKHVQKSSSDEGFVAAVSSDADDADRRLLSKLLSQLETLRDEEMLEELNIQKVDDCPEVVDKNESAADESSGSGSGSGSELGKEDIVGELKKLRRQNLITHALLSAMIVLTVAWQLSEFTLMMKVKEGLSNPLKTFRGMLLGMIRQRPRVSDQEEEKEESQSAQSLKASALPGLKITDHLPQVELPGFDFVDEDD